MLHQQRIVIVGAGIVGLSTAYALLAQGMRNVTVLEQEIVDHERSGSHGFSRLLRFEYGTDAFYSNMVRLSLKRWKNLERVTGRIIYTPTGLLVLGNEDDTFTQSSYHIVRGLGLPVEQLLKEDCRLRFPQFNTQPYDTITYNYEAGILHASTCLQALRDLILALGGEIYESCRVTRLSNDDQLRPIYLHLSSGTEIAADRVVLAIGSWVHRLLGNLRLPVRTTRQYLLYFAGLNSSLYSAGAFPAFFAGDLYGFPIHKGCNGWVKASSHEFGRPMAPAEVTTPDEQVISDITRQLQELLPALKEAELTRIDSCLYDVTPDEGFILDRLPHNSRVILASGLSGHGFKFGLLLGEMLSSMVCDTQPPVPLDRFRLSRFDERQGQTNNLGDMSEEWERLAPGDHKDIDSNLLHHRSSGDERRIGRQVPGGKFATPIPEYRQNGRRSQRQPPWQD
jgi:monomeric sarcosine oxidase